MTEPLALLRSELATLPLRRSELAERRLARAVATGMLLEQVPEVTLRPSILIWGLPRSGSTLLHELLAMSPELRAPTYARTRWPLGDPELGHAEAEAFLEMSKATTGDLLTTWHRTMIDGPEECRVLLEPTLWSIGFATEYPLPRYASWVDSGIGAVDAWSSLARMLGWMGDEQWVLKDVSHTGTLLAAVGALGDATVLRLHRDPAKSLASACSLVERLWRVSIDGPIDRDALGTWMLTRYAAGTRRDAVIPATEVDFDHLSNDPLGVVRSLGLDVTGAMIDHVALHPRPSPRAIDPGRYGLDTDTIRAAFRGEA